jgi:hypothetical protein
LPYLLSMFLACLGVACCSWLVGHDINFDWSKMRLKWDVSAGDWYQQIACLRVVIPTYSGVVGSFPPPKGRVLWGWCHALLWPLLN